MLMYVLNPFKHFIMALSAPKYVISQNRRAADQKYEIKCFSPDTSVNKQVGWWNQR